MWLMNNIFLETWWQWLCCFDLCHFKALWSDYSSKYWRFTLACCFAMWKSIARNKRPQTERFCWKSTHRKSWTYCWRMFCSQWRKEIQSLACRWRVFYRFHFYSFFIKLLFLFLFLFFILSFSCMCMIFLPLYYCYLMYLKKRIACARSIGDADYKDFFLPPEEQALCCIPDIYTLQINEVYSILFFYYLFSLSLFYQTFFRHCLIVCSICNDFVSFRCWVWYSHVFVLFAATVFGT